jgi:hypothetical protein
MSTTGAIFEQELIELMMSALDGAASVLPEAKQTPAAKLKLASRIIAAAARGERDPTHLRMAALLEIGDDQVEDNLERSYLQLQRLREKVRQAEAAALGKLLPRTLQ